MALKQHMNGNQMKYYSISLTRFYIIFIRINFIVAYFFLQSSDFDTYIFLQ